MCFIMSDSPRLRLTMIFALFCVQMLIFTNAELSEVTTRSRHIQHDASNTFAGLLRDLVQVNERRFEAMKQLARLQDYTYSGIQRPEINTKEEIGMPKLKLRTRLEAGSAGQGIQRNHRTDGPVVVFVKKEKRRPLRNGKVNWLSEILKPQKSSNHPTGMNCDPTNGKCVPIARVGTVDSAVEEKAVKICTAGCKKSLEIVCYSTTCLKDFKKEYKSNCLDDCVVQFREFLTSVLEFSIHQ